MTELSTVSNKLTPERQRLLEKLDEGMYDSITDLCAAAKVDRGTYYDAIKDEGFVALLFQTTSGKIYKSIPKIMDKVVQQAEKGSFAHQKMLFEMMKIYQGQPTVAVQQNIQVNNYSPADLLEEAYTLVAQDKGISVDELRSK